ncbi:PPC domain-containing protein [Brevibacillus sp. IT-7CA2]
MYISHLKTLLNFGYRGNVFLIINKLEVITLKKFIQTTLLAFSAMLVIPTSALASSPQTQSTDAVAPASKTTEVLRYTKLESRSSVDSKLFDIQSPGKLTVHVTQKSRLSSIKPNLTYRILSFGPDGSSRTLGTGRFEGSGSFTFTSPEELPAGKYYILVRNTGIGRAVGTVSVTIP